MHQGPPLLVLPNAWDVASARAFASIPGCAAIATSSAAVARSLGWEDGEQAPVEEMLRVVERIVAAVEIPVTADLEAGYGDPPRTAAAALAVGAAGMNLEDSRADVQLPLEEQVAIIRAVRVAAPELVLNARVDVFLGGSADVAEAVERGNAYLAAGADCVYPIFLGDPALVKQFVDGVGGHVNVNAGRSGATLAELGALGVSRISAGGGIFFATLNTVKEAAEAMFGAASA